MTRTTVLVERTTGNKAMSPDGIQELWTNLLESNPDIKGLIIELDDVHELPPMYEGTEVEGAEGVDLGD